MNALQANPDDRAARIMQARVQLALGDGVAAESEIARARQSGVPAERDRAICSPMPGCCRTIRRALCARARRSRRSTRPMPRASAAAPSWRSATTAHAQAEFDRALAIAPRDSWVLDRRRAASAARMATSAERWRRSIAPSLPDPAMSRRWCCAASSPETSMALPPPCPGSTGRSRSIRAMSPPCSNVPSPMAISVAWRTCSPTSARSTV